jgi:hypothetical protein
MGMQSLVRCCCLPAFILMFKAALSMLGEHSAVVPHAHYVLEDVIAVYPKVRLSSRPKLTPTLDRSTALK